MRIGISVEDYEARVEARLERLRARASKRAEEAAALSGRARVMGDAIPFGQPLVGSPDSMRRQRNYRDRIHATYMRAHAAHEEATDLSRRADAAETRGAVSSDDPAAVEKLRNKLAEAEAEHALHLKVNALWRRGGAQACIDAGIEPGVVAYAIRTMALCPYLKGPFFGSNSAASIRRIKARIAELEHAATVPEAAPVHGPGYRVEEDSYDNRIKIYFDTKPGTDARSTLKSAGFKWSPSNSAWQRQLNAAGRYAAVMVVKTLFQESGT